MGYFKDIIFSLRAGDIEFAKKLASYNMGKINNHPDIKTVILAELLNEGRKEKK